MIAFLKGILAAIAEVVLFISRPLYPFIPSYESPSIAEQDIRKARLARVARLARGLLIVFSPAFCRLRSPMSRKSKRTVSVWPLRSRNYYFPLPLLARRDALRAFGRMLPMRSSARCCVERSRWTYRLCISSLECPVMALRTSAETSALAKLETIVCRKE